MFGQRHGAREVTAQMEDGRLGVADLTEDLVVGLIPAVVPLCRPVVGDAVGYLVVPVGIEFKLHHWQVDVDLTSVEEMEFRVADTADQQRHERTDYCRASHCLEVVMTTVSLHILTYLIS